jgi:hypothetical protein
MPEQQETFFEIISLAIEMLKDRSRQEADLIYHIATLDNESKTSIISTYKLIYKMD